MASRKPNWTAIQAAYVGGDTAPDIAARFNVSVDQVEGRAARGKWGAQRREASGERREKLPGAVADAQVAAAVAKGAPLTEAEGQSILASIARDTAQLAFARIAAIQAAGKFGGWSGAQSATGGLADALALVRERRAKRAGEQP